MLELVEEEELKQRAHLRAPPTHHLTSTPQT